MRKIKIPIIILCIIGITCIFFITHYDINSEQIPILLYHHFLSNNELQTVSNNDNYIVSEEVFEEQMKYLHDNGYESITLDKLYCWKQKKCKINKKSFVITIDDGLTSTYKYAKPILEKYNYNATLFTITSRIKDTTEEWNPKNYQYIGNDIINNNNNTISIQSHSHNMHHKEGQFKAIETMNYKSILKDVSQSKQIIKANYFSYPYNTYNAYVFKALKNTDYKLAFRGTSHKTYRNEYKYMTSRIFINNDIERFKSIFETNRFNQTIIEKIKTDIILIKKWVIK